MSFELVIGFWLGCFIVAYPIIVDISNNYWLNPLFLILIFIASPLIVIGGYTNYIFYGAFVEKNKAKVLGGGKV